MGRILYELGEIKGILQGIADVNKKQDERISAVENKVSRIEKGVAWVSGVASVIGIPTLVSWLMGGPKT